MTYPPSPNPLGMPHYDDLLADAVAILRIDVAEAAGQLTPLQAEAARHVPEAHARWTWEAMADEVRLEWQNDGCLLGEDNGSYAVYDAQTPAGEVRPVMPAPGSRGAAHPVDTTIFYVQGVWHDVPMHYTEMQQLADASGARVIGIHNGAGPLQWISDAAQVLGDKLAFLVPPAELVHNKAADTVAHVVEAAATTHEPVVLFGHSHGALCISRGLRQADDDLTSGKGSFPGGALGLVTVDTFGGAGLTYPVGPSYRHYMNADDNIVKEMGYGHLAGADVTALEQFLDPSHPELHLFHDSSDGGGTDPNHHSFGDIYLRHFTPSTLPQHTFPHHLLESAANEHQAAVTIELDDWESPGTTELDGSASQQLAAEHQPDEGSHPGHPATHSDGDAYQLYAEKTGLPTRDHSWYPVSADSISELGPQNPTGSAHLDQAWSYPDQSAGGWPWAHDPEQDEFDYYSRFDYDDYDSDDPNGDSDEDPSDDPNGDSDEDHSDEV